jgi:hypothetical protein
MAKPTKPADKQENQSQEIQYVRMVRDSEAYSAPHEAQVHPDEVENYRPGGWEVAEAE